MPILDLLALPFFQHSLLAGALIGLATGLMGVFVVVNRLSFLAGGVAHSAYGGVGLAAFMGWPITLTASVFSVALSALMGVLARRQSDRVDALIGTMWAMGMALGILLLSQAPGYNADMMSYLFGNILLVDGQSLYAMAALCGLLLLLLGAFYPAIQLYCFDAEYAQTRGLPVGLMATLSLALVALVVVLSISVVGLVLVIALLTIPAYIAEHWARELWQMFVYAVLLSVGFCLSGLLLAAVLDWPPGASIVACACVGYGVSEIAQRWRR